MCCFRLHVVGLVAVVVCGVDCVFSGGALTVGVIARWSLFLAMLYVYLCVITDWLVSIWGLWVLFLGLVF